MHRVLQRTFLLLLVAILVQTVPAQDTVKIMSWNLLNYPGDQTLNREPSYRTVIGSVNPDIFVCQEMAGTQTDVDYFYNNVITQVLTNFAKGTFINGYDTDNALFYRSTKFQFISNTAIHTALRDITEFKLVHIASGDTLRIYSVHLKSSSGSTNEAARAAEVDSLRKVTNLLGTGKNFIVCGDFNIYNSNESAYQKLLQVNGGDEGYFIDPITMPYPSNWNNGANAQYHTQSPRVRSFGGGATGGMNDRFDLILYSNAVSQTGGIYYIPGSMTEYGNDGNHYNDSINKMPNTAVSATIADAIHWASDHIPVYAQFSFPSGGISEPTAQPTSLNFSSVTSSSLTGSFTAASPSAAGYLVLRKAGSAPTGSPSDGSSYTAGNTIGDGTVVSSGSGTSFNETGLTSSTTYYYSIFSYNGSGSSTNYLTTNPLQGSVTTLTPDPATITVGSSSLSFSNTVANTNSAEQSYTVSAANLTADLIITPPVGYGISLTSGSGFVNNPSTLNITPSGGTVSSRSIYVRFSPTTASGTISGNITNTSSGATTKNVSVSGAALSVEPTVSASIVSCDSSTNTITMSAGNGTNRILVARASSAVSFAPTDANAISGVNSNFISATDQGSGNKVVYDGTGTSVQLTGLTGGTTYYLAVYEYNLGTNNSQNYLTSSYGTGNFTTLNSQTYNWVGTTTNFTTASNWSPTRSTPDTMDILSFSNGTTVSVTNIPTQKVGQITVSNNTTVNFSATAACTLSVRGGAGIDLSIASGSALNLSGSSAIVLSMLTGTTSSISGSMTSSSAAHKLLSADASSVTFQSGATFTMTSSASGNVFGTTYLNSVVFASGASFVQNSTGASNPFGAGQPNSVVVFQHGSWYRMQQSSGFALSGRTYANLEINNSSYTGNLTGGAALVIDTLKITAGTPSFNLTGGISILGDIIVGSGYAVSFNPASENTIQFSGTVPQGISGSGTLTFASKASVKINNINGVSLYKDVTIKDTLFLTKGVLNIGSNNLTFDTSAAISGTFSDSAMIAASGAGEVRKMITSNRSFAFPIGNSGVTQVYTPVDVTLNSNSGLSSAYISAKVITGKNANLYDQANYLTRSWSLASSGITNPSFNVTPYYTTGILVGDENVLYAGKWNGIKWSLGDKANTVANSFSVRSESSLGTYSAAGFDYVGGAAILKVKMIIQGFYDEAIDKMRLSDSVKIKLWNAVSPNAYLDSCVAVIDSSTFEGYFAFRNVNSNTCYLEIINRNAITTWSRDGGELLEKGKFVLYDFTSDSLKTLGQNVIKINNQWCIYNGDINQDGFIDFSDLGLVDNDAYNYVSGFVVTDVNGDLFVDFSDLGLVDNNAYNYIGSVAPAFYTQTHPRVKRQLKIKD